jgi:hypothetical protein
MVCCVCKADFGGVFGRTFRCLFAHFGAGVTPLIWHRILPGALKPKDITGALVNVPDLASTSADGLVKCRSQPQQLGRAVHQGSARHALIRHPMS